MPDIASTLPWKAALPGICVTLINMHGESEAFTQHSVQFPLTVDGREDAAELLRALELLPAAVRKHENINEIATDLAEQLSFTRPATTELTKQLVDLLRPDCTESDYLAKPVAYLVDMCDFHGVLSRAQFADIDGSGDMVGFRQLSSTVAPEFFSAWE